MMLLLKKYCRDITIHITKSSMIFWTITTSNWLLTVIVLPNSPPISDNPGQPRHLYVYVIEATIGGMPIGCPITCPPEWIRALAESFRRVFANDGEITINNPFLGGYISQVHYGRKGIPWIQIEINRRLYLNEAYFNPDRMKVRKKLILGLRKKKYGMLLYNLGH